MIKTRLYCYWKYGSEPTHVLDSVTSTSLGCSYSTGCPSRRALLPSPQHWSQILLNHTLHCRSLKKHVFHNNPCITYLKSHGVLTYEPYLIYISIFQICIPAKSLGWVVLLETMYFPNVQNVLSYKDTTVMSWGVGFPKAPCSCARRRKNFFSHFLPHVAPYESFAPASSCGVPWICLPSACISALWKSPYKKNLLNESKEKCLKFLLQGPGKEMTFTLESF